MELWRVLIGVTAPIQICSCLRSRRVSVIGPLFASKRKKVLMRVSEVALAASGLLEPSTSAGIISFTRAVDCLARPGFA